MADKSIFSRLRRLFSTDVIIRNVGGDDLRVIDINKIQQTGTIETNSIYDRFSRLHVTGNANVYNMAMNYQLMRVQLYSEYEVMDQDAICASTLDILADESTLKNDFGEVLQIRSSDEDTQKILYNLFYDVLNVEFNLWSWIRNMCKYGDFFLKLEIAEKYGVYNVIPYTAYNIVREEGYDEDELSKVRFRFDPNGVGGEQNYASYGVMGKKSNGNIYFDNYEMSHFRLLADVNYLPYGRSYLEPGRKVWKQLIMMEDAMLVHRIVRAPEKRIFYMNVGGIPPNEVDAFMEKTISKMKRTPYIDPQTGQYNLKFNLQNMLEDYYIPVRGNDNTTKIDTTKGLEYDGIEDVNYLRNKLFAALKIPKAFLGYDENLQGKATLAAEDIRFARTVERIQKIIISELYKIALVHLYTQGYRDEQLTNFELSLTTPSIIYEQERVMLMKEKVELANLIIENKLLPSDYVYDYIFQFSQDQYDEFRELIVADQKRKFRYKQIEEEGNDPLESGVSYGTPHDLASLYGKGRYQSNTDDVPDGYGDDLKMGRPKEKVSKMDTQEDPLGKDRLGKISMKLDDQPGLKPLKEKLSSQVNPKTEYLKNKKLLESISKKKKTPKKKLFVESDKQKESLLDENQLID
jgi:hypothetical protein